MPFHRVSVTGPDSLLDFACRPRAAQGLRGRALDYFYWLGARSVLRDNRCRRQGLTSLEDAAGELDQ